jgi:dihydrofolate synthase/folylpolyglutamate synthase
VIDRLLALQTLGVKMGLDGIGRLCEALGHPQRSFTALHVAGTNGKGSVAAMAHEALVAAGLRAGRYTSPHLHDLSERFVVNRAPVDDNELRAAADRVLACADQLVKTGGLPALPTFFEATTTMAFELFRSANVEVAVIEVGLGGRFDATNILAPPVGAITSVGLDHQEHLGQTIEAIAQEKAGIIKTGMAVVTGALPPPAAEVITRVAHARGARVIEAAAEARVKTEVIEGRTRLTVDTPVDSYGPLALALRGEHQVGNALVTVRLLEAARAAGMVVSQEAITQGLSGVVWPARLELLVLTDGRRVLIDVAHNGDGASALAAYLHRWFPERPILIVGAMDDKDLDGMLRALLPVTGSVVATAAALPRAVPPVEVARRVRAVDPDRVVDEAPTPAEALTRALTLGRSVCTAGSIFVAGAVREAAKPRAILRDDIASP